MAADDIVRKIHFYRAEAERDETGALLSFDPVPWLDHIESIPHGKNRRLRLNDGEHLYCWVHDGSPRPCLSMATTRTLDLPSIEEGGTINALDIGQDAGLAELTHVVFFEKNIVGADFNYYGPRLSRLSGYLRSVRRNPYIGVPSFETLLNPDIARSLEEHNEIRLFSLRIRSSDINKIEERNESLGRSLRAQAELGETGEVGVYLKQEGNKRRNIDSSYLDIAKDFVGDDVVRNCAVDFKIKVVGSDNRVLPLDLLESQLLFRKRVRRQGPQTKTIDPSSAFAAIEEAYAENKERIQHASSIG